MRILFCSGFRIQRLKFKIYDLSPRFEIIRKNYDALMGDHEYLHFPNCSPEACLSISVKLKDDGLRLWPIGDSFAMNIRGQTYESLRRVGLGR